MYQIDVNKSPRIQKLLRAQVGEKTDLSQFAVFELRANDTLPITKAGGLLKDSRMTSTYLNQMAQLIQDRQYVPMIELHDTYSKLPIGRVIDAKVYDNLSDFSQKDLHLIVYFQADTTNAKDIAAGIINEVSTGTTPSSLTCSACNFDFYASPENRRKLWEGKNYTPLCDNGHQWGMNGNHLQLSGLKEWRETSIVPRGAAPNAKVLKEGEFRLAYESDQINLSDTNHVDILLSTVEGVEPLGLQKPADFTPSSNPNKGKKGMDVNLSQEKYDELVAAKALKEKAEADAKQALADLAAKEGELSKALSDKATAETDKQTAETNLAAKETELTNLQADLTAANAKLAIYAAGGKPEGSGNPADNQGGDAAPTGVNLGAEFYTPRSLK